MSFYRVCPICKANLDPGEICDCRRNLEAQTFNMLMQLPEEDRWRIISKYVKKAAQGAVNTRSGMVELIDHGSTSILL